MKNQRHIGVVCAITLFFVWTYLDAPFPGRTTKPASVSQKIGNGVQRLYGGAKQYAARFTKNFGRTHFIVGYSDDTAKSSASEAAPKADAEVHEGPFGLICNGHVKQAFFSPDDDVQNVLLHLIDTERERIRLALYTVTDKAVVQALLRAYRRGVLLEVVVDSSCLQDRYNKIGLLHEHNVPLYVYDLIKRSDGKYSLMHHKFFIFSKNMLEKSLVWTGSYNATRSAHERNQENVIVFDEPWLVTKYEQQFERLKQRSIRYVVGREH